MFDCVLLLSDTPDIASSFLSKEKSECLWGLTGLAEKLPLMSSLNES